MRLAVGGYFFRKYVSQLTGKPAPYSAIQESFTSISKSLDFIESKWLKQGYLVGDQISIADLSLCCELATLKQIDYDYSKWVNLSRWMKMMHEVPEVALVHKGVID